MTLLDAGVGTGLCGEHFLPWASKMIGVDLSDAMLARAREKGHYDELIQGDIADVLMRRVWPDSIDMVVSTDVFVYSGNLTAIFRAVAAAAKPGAIFAFTTEAVEFLGPNALEASTAHPSGGWVVQKTGRFAHTKGYLNSLLREHGFSHGPFSHGPTDGPRVASSATRRRRWRTGVMSAAASGGTAGGAASSGGGGTGEGELFLYEKVDLRMVGGAMLRGHLFVARKAQRGEQGL